MSLYLKLASQRLQQLGEMCKAGEIKPFPYSHARERLSKATIKAYYAKRGQVAEFKEYAWCTMFTVSGQEGSKGYGDEVANIIRNHCMYRTGTSWGVNLCQGTNTWGYVTWIALPTIVHHLAGNPDAKIY